MVWLSRCWFGTRVQSVIPLVGWIPAGIDPVQVTVTVPGAAGAATVCSGGVEAEDTATTRAAISVAADPPTAIRIRPICTLSAPCAVGLLLPHCARWVSRLPLVGDPDLPAIVGPHQVVRLILRE